mmetsp:Transcript_79899/g.166124  ORF Transcript_79899/g.166124 Transcript_79899/m.166124 type:complete len:112 (+) Transcript_79899:24-359(+)
MVFGQPGEFGWKGCKGVLFTLECEGKMTKDEKRKKKNKRKKMTSSRGSLQASPAEEDIRCLRVAQQWDQTKKRNKCRKRRRTNIHKHRHMDKQIDRPRFAVRPCTHTHIHT